MWSFEGDYKKRPKQSLSGKSKSIDRQALLQKLKIEREEREDQRRRVEAAIRIQAWSRGIASRRRVKQVLRNLCDKTLNSIKSEGLTKERVEDAIRYLIKMFAPSQDAERLLFICQLLIKEQAQLSRWVCTDFLHWKYLVPRIVSLALEILAFVPDGKGTKSGGGSHAVPLRLLEVVSYPDKWEVQLEKEKKYEFLNSLFTFLQMKGYYSHLIQILLSKVPEIYEPTTVSPTPLCESLLNLIIEPLKIVATLLHSTNLVYSLHAELAKEIFSRASHSQVRNHILPFLATFVNENSWFVESFLVYMDQNLECFAQSRQPSSYLLSLLIVISTKIEINEQETFIRFLNIAGHLLEKSPLISKMSKRSSQMDNGSESEEEEDEEYLQMDTFIPNLDTNSKMVCDICLLELNSTDRVSWLLNLVERYVYSSRMLVCFAKLFHYICIALKYKLHDCRLLFSVVLKRHLLLRPMWRVLSSLQQGKLLLHETSGGSDSTNSAGTPLLQILAFGYPLSSVERDTLVPLLSTFSASLIAVLATLHDSEMLGEDSLLQQTPKINYFPFTVEEVVQMSATLRDVCVGLVELAHPDIRMSTYIDGSYKAMWELCFKVCVGVVYQIHLRDTRRQFCPSKHWLSSKVFLPLKNESSKSFVFNPRSRRRYRRLFEPPKWLTKDELEMDGPPLSIAEQRRATLLQALPFVFPFEARLGVFTTLIANDREQFQNSANYGIGPSINVTIRRTHIYEDAFEKLSPTNESNLHLKMRVHLLNAVGMNEAGIDGGGIFREFLSELLKTAFDPNRGFFLMTRENTLYPNPSARLIAEDFENHYYFIGRMLGKALYENLLVEMPLAGFFLSKLLGKKSSSVEFHYLDSLDPELCKNLLYLKNYEGDIQELGLDFTVLNAELGQNSIEELMPNGANVPVTRENCIEYIYRMADYKLNKQIAKQCQAFKEGLFNVIEARWLRLFDWRELQMMVSGASVPIDVEDLKINTKYSGQYSEVHPTIISFWNVVSSFSESQCRSLLKFVTSCSRPPLLGFKELFPAFCIQPSGTEEDRLPSSSTCMNLLKLPEYKDEKTLKEKLLYAISANAGFELS